MVFTFGIEQDYLRAIRAYYSYKLDMLDCQQSNIISFLNYVQDKRDQFNIEGISPDPDYGAGIYFKQYYFGNVDFSNTASDITTTTVAVPLTSWASASGEAHTYGDSNWMYLPYPMGYGIPSNKEVFDRINELTTMLKEEEEDKKDKKINHRFELLDLE
jgi:hypothetical protein